MSFFPSIPIISTGQALGATHLNLYTRALQDLLGRGHSTFSAHRSRNSSSIATAMFGDSIVWGAWGYSYSRRIRLIAFIGPDVFSRDGQVRFRFRGDDGLWYDIADLSTTTAYPFNLVNQVYDLSGHPQMSENRWYNFEVRAWGEGFEAGHFRVHFYPWVVALEPEAPVLLPSPAFTNSTLSAAANFNTVREKHN
jgi:hypothetical protein